MSIVKTVNAPTTGPRIVEQALQDLLPHSDTRGGRETFSTGVVDISRPIPVYRLRLDDIEAIESPPAVEQVGWRYVVRTDPDRFGVVDLNGVQDERVSFSSFSQNSNSKLFVEALHIAQDEAQKSEAKCEIRSLDMPSLYVAAIWVTSEPPAFIPYITPKAFPSEALRVDYSFVEKLAAAAKSEQVRGMEGHSPDFP